MDEIAKQIGCKPDMTTIFKQDPKLALHCLFGPCFPSQYRLVGPGRWNGAKRAIIGGMGRSLAPLSSNILPKNAKNTKIEDDSSQDICITVQTWLTSYFILFFIFCMLFCMCVVWYTWQITDLFSFQYTFIIWYVASSVYYTSVIHFSKTRLKNGILYDARTCILTIMIYMFTFLICAKSSK